MSTNVQNPDPIAALTCITNLGIVKKKKKVERKIGKRDGGKELRWKLHLEMDYQRDQGIEDWRKQKSRRRRAEAEI